MSCQNINYFINKFTVMPNTVKIFLFGDSKKPKKQVKGMPKGKEGRSGMRTIYYVDYTARKATIHHASNF